MRQVIAGRLLPLRDVLLDALRRSAAGQAPLALYVVRLTETAGLALATAMFTTTGGPDPTHMLTRARRAGGSNPMLVRAAPIAALSHVLDNLTDLPGPDRNALTSALADVPRRGDVPIVTLLDGIATVTTLSALGTATDSPPPSRWRAAGDA